MSMRSVLLCNKFVSNRLQNNRLVEFCADEMTESWLQRLTLAVNDLALGFSFLLSLLVRFDSVEEILTTARMFHMLHTDIDALRNYSLLDTLVNDDTECVWRNVVHNPSSSMVALVGHTLLHRTVSSDVDNVSFFVCFHILRQRDDALCAKLA